MGTRAIISKNGRPIIATHWDGNPESLGKDLKNTKTDRDILEQSSKHNIDFIDKSFAPDEPLTVNDGEKVRTTYFPKTDKEMVEIGKKVGLIDKKLSIKKAIKEGFGTSNLDGTIKLTGVGNLSETYGDWAEYQYDFRDGEWFVRPLNSVWDKSKIKDKTGFKILKEVI